MVNIIAERQTGDCTRRVSHFFEMENFCLAFYRLFKCYSSINYSNSSNKKAMLIVMHLLPISDILFCSL